MLNKIQLDKILFLDIETVPLFETYEKLTEVEKEFYAHKMRLSKEEIEQDVDIYNRAGIYAEFGKIICISVGFVRETRTGKSIRLKSFYHDDEEILLKQFADLVNEHYNTPYHILCGHNSKEFDIPYICRRLLIHRIKLPNILNIAGKKPWEIQHLDTMELWKFGDYKAYTSLNLLCYIFNIPTPKDDISGADVARVYYQENNLDKIKKYCEKDVVALIQLFLAFQGEPMVQEENINFS